MKKALLLAVLTLIGLSIGLAAESDYAELTVSNVRLQWKVEGENLSVIVSAPTTGWVGFAPSQKMKDASIIIGYVKDGRTELKFTIPLNSKDAKDQELVPGKEVKVIMAYGPNGADVFTQYHAFRTTVTIKL